MLKFSRRTIAAIVLISIAISAAMGYGTTKLTTKVQYEQFLPEHYPSVKTLKEYQERFPSASQIMLLIESENVARADAIERILLLENLIQQDAVIQTVLLQKTSYLTYVLPLILENTGGMLPQGVQLEIAVQQVLTRPEVAGMVVGKYITADQKAALLTVSISADAPEETKNQIVDRVREYADSVADENFAVRVTGDVALYRDMHSMMDQDNRILIPTAIVLVAAIIFVIFRRLSDIPMALLVVGVGTLWTVGLMGHLGIEFTTLHVAVVPLLLGLGIDYAVHYLNRYYEECKRGIKATEAATIAVGTVGRAIAIAAVTTIIGFGSFLMSDLPPVQTLGEFLAIGIGLMFVLSASLLPAAVALRDRNRTRRAMRMRGERLRRGLARLAVGVERHWKPILAAVLLVTIPCAIVTPRISSTMSFETFLPSQIESVATLHRVEDLFGGQTSIIVLVQGATLTPEGLQDMLAVENEILSDPSGAGLITGALSIADLVAYHTDGTIPSDQQAVAATLENIENSRKAMLLSADGTAVIHIMVDARTDEQMKQATRVVREHVGGYEGVLNMRVDGDPAVTGLPPILADIMDMVMRGMRNSTTITVILCFAVLILLFRSPILGAAAITPLLIVLTWEFGTMWALGWSLDVLSMGISALIIGLGIDYAVHLIHRFREEQRKDPEQMLRQTLSSVGVPITVGAATTIGVFAVLSLSRMPAMARFGQLTALVIGYSYVAVLLALPAMLVLVGRKIKRK